MKNLDFLAKILSSNHHYWIVAKRNEGTRNTTFKDSIILISIPDKITINIERNKIMLTDLEELNRSRMDSNIFLNDPYPPFQIGMNFYDLYDGFPIDGDGINIKEVMIKSLSIKSDSLYEYEQQLKDVLTPYVEITDN